MLPILFLLLLLLQLFGVEDGGPRVRGAVSEGAVRTVLAAVALGVRLVHANGRLVVAQVVALLGVARIAMHERTLVTVGTHARLLVVFLAVDVGVVVERAIASSDGPPTALILEVPVEARVGPVLGAFVLQEERTLLDAKAFQVSVVRWLLCGLLSSCIRCRSVIISRRTIIHITTATTTTIRIIIVICSCNIIVARSISVAIIG